ncbi:imidazole glycerol phosphate synthase subunit HisF [Heyndrickxia oleronia]|uniref:Imidazole glycerol phosphate synthase subunit HisF n=1 Tax=Heyndrickxia oleronia TaxID=38875 RepID=A0A8E2IBR4_9BACI|nr:imidazole glycerol phosphate synthase subunit HisF [Heyndrickxia oleronia]MEC1376545.1 imidazole glycerol phosphate synthase subunit HisF [Heyndrickxia oleronia]OOP67021.1 imidazole glycerol phosphate synthase subunit HisF [Heyndrickxia oleronia]QQZ06988.1 imidazole glycerol phosphate synthase subunit HisF [Heyndrickxia oleronia]
MIAKRIIPCLDVKNGSVVKGVNFKSLRQLGDPVDLAKFYSENGADELVFLDISATNEGRRTMIDVVKKTAEQVFVPFTVGGGVRTIDDVTELLRAGADKIGINSAAVANPQLIKDASDRFGSQCVVVAIDAKRFPDGTWHVMTHGGNKNTGLNAIEWAKDVERLGAGEILLTSVDYDGVKDGFDIPLTKTIVDSVNIPIIASGGCGKPHHFLDVFAETNVSAGLAASIFHDGVCTIQEVKEICKENGVNIRDVRVF